MLTRRHFLLGLGGLTLGTTALGSYAFAIEPHEGPRHIVVLAGLGTSIVPVRFMRPPEVVEVTVSGPAGKGAPLLQS